MKKYSGLLVLLLVGCLLVIFGLAITMESDPLSAKGNSVEAWCDAMVEKPNKAWTEAETIRFSKSCLYD